MLPSLSVHGAIKRFVNASGAIALVGALAAMPAAARADSLRLLALGDSLTAGYGLADTETFTVQLEAALLSQGYDVQVINGGVSGDTTAGGLARLDWALADDPDLVLVELGANDGLRGIDPRTTRENLSRILEILDQRGIPTLLAGMYAPPNLGEEYGDAFDAIYPDLAEEYEVALYPFFLDGVATRPDLNQDDGIHPNGDGVAVIVEQLVPHVIELIEAAGLEDEATTG
ncbi:MAG TPA: arylesterase [Alphaproteobacteria bacterium]|nr:arylesterase [Alphaproteobacteria bacterium]